MVFEKLKEVLTAEEEGEGEEEEVRKLSVEKIENEAKERKESSVRDAKEEIQPIIEKISNLKNKIVRLGDDLADAESVEEVHPNIYKSATEARRLLLKKLDRATGSLDVPSDLEWQKLINFNRDLQSSVNLLKNASVSHGSQVEAVFGGQVNKLRRLTDRLQTFSKKLNTILRKVNLELEDIDNFLNDISERRELLERKDELETKLEKLEERKQEVANDLDKKKRSLESLKKSRRFEELEEMNEEKKEMRDRKKRIRKKIDSTISDLARPLRKMSKMIERDEHMVGREVLNALDSYLDDPVQATLSEEEDLPELQAMLRELRELLEGEMKLSDRERSKRLEEVREIIKNRKVKVLREKYYQIKDREKELRQELNSSSLLEKKNRLEGSIREKESELDRIDSKMSEIEKQLGEVQEEIEDKSKGIQESVRSVLNAEVEGL